MSIRSCRTRQQWRSLGWRSSLQWRYCVTNTLARVYTKMKMMKIIGADLNLSRHQSYAISRTVTVTDSRDWLRKWRSSWQMAVTSRNGGYRDRFPRLMEDIINGSYRDRFPWLMESGIPVTDGSRYISQGSNFLFTKENSDSVYNSSAVWTRSP